MKIYLSQTAGSISLIHLIIVTHCILGTPQKQRNTQQPLLCTAMHEGKNPTEKLLKSLLVSERGIGLR